MAEQETLTQRELEDRMYEKIVRINATKKGSRREAQLRTKLTKLATDYYDRNTRCFNLKEYQQRTMLS